MTLKEEQTAAGTDGKLRNMTAIYLWRDGKVLLLYRQGSKVADEVWVGSAGGHFEPTELNDAKACVLRELNEELSVTEDEISDLRLRYITLRMVKGEIRQNYYFFADLAKTHETELISDEGVLRWFYPEELSSLKMPFSAKYMIEHYLSTAIRNDKIYVGVAEGEGVIFSELTEF